MAGPQPRLAGRKPSFQPFSVVRQHEGYSQPIDALTQVKEKSSLVAPDYRTGVELLGYSARIIPIRANIVGPPCSPTRIGASIAVCMPASRQLAADTVKRVF